MNKRFHWRSLAKHAWWIMNLFNQKRSKVAGLLPISIWALDFRVGSRGFSVPLFVMLVLSIATSGLGAPLYSLTDLGTVGGFGLNNNGQVVGISQDSSGAHRAFLYNAGVMTDLGTLGGTNAEAYGINNNGQIVGWSSTSNAAHHAFLYDSGIMLDLGTLGGPNSEAYAINDLGEVVGWSDAGAGAPHAFLFAGGAMTNLGVGYPSAINNNSQVVGAFQTNSGPWHAFLYASGTNKDLGTLGGTNSEALGINNSGQVVGRAETATGDTHPFQHSGGTMTDLWPSGPANSRAVAINDHNEIVGAFYTNAPGGLHAFLVSDGNLVDLNDLIDSSDGWTLSYPTAINDNGWILVSAIRPNDLFHTLLLKPLARPIGLLNIALANNSLVLFWTTNARGFALFQNTNLLTTNWTAVANPPIVTNGQNQVWISPRPPGNEFFRLQSQ